MPRISRLKITAIGSTLGLLIAGGLAAGLAGPAAADAAQHGQDGSHGQSNAHVTEAALHHGASTTASTTASTKEKTSEITEPTGKDSHDGRAPHDVLLYAPMAPSVTSDPTIFGVAPGKLPWVLKSGWVTLHADGQLALHVSGLIVPAASNPKGTNSNPLPGTAAAVFCNGTMVGSTPTPVSFPSSGSVTIHTMVTLPSTCLAPTVMLLPATAPGGALTTDTKMYIAISGRG